jgi:hypothetical protein
MIPRSPPARVPVVCDGYGWDLTVGRLLPFGVPDSAPSFDSSPRGEGPNRADGLFQGTYRVHLLAGGATDRPPATPNPCIKCNATHIVAIICHSTGIRKV